MNCTLFVLWGSTKNEPLATVQGENLEFSISWELIRSRESFGKTVLRNLFARFRFGAIPVFSTLLLLQDTFIACLKDSAAY